MVLITTELLDSVRWDAAGTQLTVDGTFTDDKLRELCVALRANSTISSITIQAKHLSIAAASDISGLLENNGTIHTLSLDGVNLSEAACRSIGSALSSNSSLTSLNLGGGAIRDGGCEYIISGLMGNTSLQILNLQMNNITDITGEKLSDLFHVNKFLKALNLLGNKLTNRGLEKMSRTIGKAKLHSLNLQANGIGDSGVVVLCESLMGDRNEGISTVEFGLNKLGPPAAAALSTLLEFNFPIVSLELGWNAIGNEGAGALARGLKTNNKLRRLNLQSNGISDTGAKEIYNALTYNQTLTQMKLDGNSISDSVLQNIHLLLHNNEAVLHAQNPTALAAIPPPGGGRVMRQREKAQQIVFEREIQSAVESVTERHRSEVSELEERYERRLRDEVSSVERGFNQSLHFAIMEERENCRRENEKIIENLKIDFERQRADAVRDVLEQQREEVERQCQIAVRRAHAEWIRLRKDSEEGHRAISTVLGDNQISYLKNAVADLVTQHQLEKEAHRIAVEERDRILKSVEEDARESAEIERRRIIDAAVQRARAEALQQAKEAAAIAVLEVRQKDQMVKEAAVEIAMQEREERVREAVDVIKRETEIMAREAAQRVVDHRHIHIREAVLQAQEERSRAVQAAVREQLEREIREATDAAMNERHRAIKSAVERIELQRDRLIEEGITRAQMAVDEEIRDVIQKSKEKQREKLDLYLFAANKQADLIAKATVEQNALDRNDTLESIWSARELHSPPVATLPPATSRNFSEPPARIVTPLRQSLTNTFATPTPFSPRAKVSGTDGSGVEGSFADYPTTTPTIKSALKQYSDPLSAAKGRRVLFASDDAASTPRSGSTLRNTFALSSSAPANGVNRIGDSRQEQGSFVRFLDDSSSSGGKGLAELRQQGSLRPSGWFVS